MYKKRTLTADYYEYINSPQWREKRKQVAKRDKGKCQKCGKKGNQVHHLTYDHFKNEPLSDLILLCKRCHKKADKERKFGGSEITPQDNSKVRLILDLDYEVYKLLEKMSVDMSYSEFIEKLILTRG